MSSQLLILNGLLRSMVKPSAGLLGRTSLEVRQYRPLVCRAASVVPLSDRIRVTPQDFGHFRAEWVDCLDSDADSRDNVVLYLPGGAFSLGSPITHRGITTRLAKHGNSRVLALRYRKVPEHPYPAAREDTLLAYQWLLDQGFDASNIVIAGDSSGGNLTLAALVAIRDRQLPCPGAGVLFSPWIDLAGRGDSMRFNAGVDAMIPTQHVREGAELYANGRPLDDPGVSPLYADLAGLPPLLVHVGDREILLSDATRLTHKARASGVTVELKIWRGAPHAFQIFAGFVPQGRDSLRKAASFIRRVRGTTPEISMTEDGKSNTPAPAVPI